MILRIHAMISNPCKEWGGLVGHQLVSLNYLASFVHSQNEAKMSPTMYVHILILHFLFL